MKDVVITFLFLNSFIKDRLMQIFQVPLRLIVDSKDAGRSGDEMKHAACVVAVSRLCGLAVNPWCPPAAISPFTPFPVIPSISLSRWDKYQLRTISREQYRSKQLTEKDTEIISKNSNVNLPFLLFQAKSRVKEVYTQTCAQLSQEGMRDCELFGLAILSGEL